MGSGLKKEGKGRQGGVVGDRKQAGARVVQGGSKRAESAAELKIGPRQNGRGSA